MSKMNIDRVRQLAGLPLTESKIVKENRYDSSVDFEDAASKAAQALKTVATIFASAEWQDWMESTDSNFGSSNKFAQRSKELLHGAAFKLSEDFDKLYDDLVRVSEE